MWYFWPVGLQRDQDKFINSLVLRELSEISSGGGLKTGEGHSFLSPSKGRVT